MEQFLSQLEASKVDFVVTPPSVLEIECPLCVGLLVDPRLSSCCGHHFCGECLHRIENQPCPLCKGQFVTMRNLGLQRTILAMDVYCLHRSRGCHWKEKITLLYEHLTGQGDNRCQYVLVDCPLNCGYKCARWVVEDHVKLHCTKRPVMCPFCNCRCTWQELTEEHSSVCPDVPVICPNGCECTLVQSQLQDHLDLECLLQVVRCVFAKCKWKGQRQELKHHVRENLTEHLTRACEEVFQEVLLESGIPLQFQFQLHDLELSLPPTRHGNRFQKRGSDSDLVDTSCTFVVGKFARRFLRNETYKSPPFYARYGSYKLRVQIRPRGTGRGAGTHVSLYFFLLPGKHDVNLKWPFQGSITIALKNQAYIGDDYEKTIQYDKLSDGKCATVTDKRPSCGHGFDCFISHKYLQNPPLGRAFLVGDRLEFRICRVTCLT